MRFRFMWLPLWETLVKPYLLRMAAASSPDSLRSFGIGRLDLQPEIGGVFVLEMQCDSLSEIIHGFVDRASLGDYRYLHAFSEIAGFLARSQDSLYRPLQLLHESPFYFQG